MHPLPMTAPGDGGGRRCPMKVARPEHPLATHGAAGGRSTRIRGEEPQSGTLILARTAPAAGLRGPSPPGGCARSGTRILPLHPAPKKSNTMEINPGSCVFPPLPDGCGGVPGPQCPGEGCSTSTSTSTSSNWCGLGLCMEWAAKRCGTLGDPSLHGAMPGPHSLIPRSTAEGGLGRAFPCMDVYV